MNQIKLLALDLDGTCLNSKVKIAEETKQKIREVIEKGVIVVPTTGRSLAIFPDDLFDIYDFDYYISSSGTAILGKDKKPTHFIALEKEQIKTIFDLLKDIDVYYEFYIEEENYISEKDYKRLATYIDEKYHNLYETAVKHISEEELQELLFTKPVQKIEIRLHSNDRDRQEEIFKLIKTAVPDINIDHQIEGTNEITHANSSKGRSLKVLADRLHIKPEEIMAIGDGENDKSMLRFAGIGVAMGQANETVKEAADFITDTNDNHGVAKAIDQFILEVE